MQYIKGVVLGLLILIPVGFFVASILDKKEDTGVSKEYMTLNKEYTEYDGAASVARKVGNLVNIRTKEDYAELERTGRTYLSDKLYSDYLKGKQYAGVYKKDTIKVTSIKGQVLEKGNYLFKVELTRNQGMREVYLVTVTGGHIVNLRSLGDV